MLILNYLQGKPAGQARGAEQAWRPARPRLQQADRLRVPQRRASTQREGYEWFGGTAPAHEALTAYGLLQFRDMAKVATPSIRTWSSAPRYLLSPQDGKGGFQRNPGRSTPFGRAPRAHHQRLHRLGPHRERARTPTRTTSARSSTPWSSRPRTSQGSLLPGPGRQQPAQPRACTSRPASLLKKLASLQKTDGHLDGEPRRASPVRAAATCRSRRRPWPCSAWLKANRPGVPRSQLRAVKWIGQQRGGYGGFGSTQSTILALKALIALHQGQPASRCRPARLALTVNGTGRRRSGLRRPTSRKR